MPAALQRVAVPWPAGKFDGIDVAGCTHAGVRVVTRKDLLRKLRRYAPGARPELACRLAAGSAPARAAEQGTYCGYVGAATIIDQKRRISESEWAIPPVPTYLDRIVK